MRAPAADARFSSSCSTLYCGVIRRNGKRVGIVDRSIRMWSNRLSRATAPLAEQLVGQAPGVEVLQRAGVDAERPGQVGLGVAPLQHGHVHARLREITREQQAGRPGADDGDGGPIDHDKLLTGCGTSGRQCRGPRARSASSGMARLTAARVSEKT